MRMFQSAKGVSRIDVGIVFFEGEKSGNMENGELTNKK